MEIFFAPPNTLGGPTHDGSLGETRYLSGVIARQMIPAGGNLKYITASFLLKQQEGNSGKIRVWYIRTRASGDINVNLSVFATHLKKGDTPNYNIFNNNVTSHTLKGGSVLENIVIPFSDADFSGKGQFSVLLDFQNLNDEDTFIVGVELKTD